MSESTLGGLEQDRLFRSIIEHSTELITLLDREGRVMYVSPSHERLLGYTGDEIVGADAFLMVHPRDLPRAIELFQELLATPGASKEMEHRFRRAEGGWVHLRSIGQNLLDDPDVRAIVVISRDATERKAAELALQRSEERFRLIARLSRSVIYDWDAATNRVERSDGLYSAFGYTESAPDPGWWEERHHPEDAGRVRADIAAAISGTGDRWQMTYRLRRADGSYATVEDLAHIVRDQDGRATRVIGVGTDVSRQTEMAEQLRHAQQMEAIGRLAGGIAHEFNNMLTVIVAYTDMLRDRMRGEDDASDLNEIRAAADRAVALTRQLLAFSRKAPLSAGVIDVLPVVREMRQTLSRILGDSIRIDTRIEADEARVIADAGQLQQVLVNLSMNARDAMPDGGTIELCVRRTSIEPSRRHPVLSAGEYLLIEVRDTGRGMDRATLRRIFDPFFTTKPVGEGAGLGLPTTYAIVAAAGGHIGVHSAPGVGSVFSVYWPVAGAADEVPRAASAPRTERPRGTGRILVVDDEPAVRALATRVLRKSGYEVAESSNGREALEYLASHDPPDLVLTDYVMPGMSGAELAERVREQWPEVGLLFMSGFAGDRQPRNPRVAAGAADAAIGMLEKPFGPQVLLQAVAQALHGSAR